MVGLGSVDNTSDIDKPLSNAVKEVIEKVLKRRWNWDYNHDDLHQWSS
jgi:hypothetical protein